MQDDRDCARARQARLSARQEARLLSAAVLSHSPLLQPSGWHMDVMGA